MRCGTSDVAAQPIRRVGDGVELWRARPDGRDAQRVAVTAGDVRRFAWAPDGAGLVIQTATSRDVLSNRLRNAELHGYAVDDRLEARYSLLPMPDEASGKTVVFAGLSGQISAAFLPALSQNVGQALA